MRRGTRTGWLHGASRYAGQGNNCIPLLTGGSRRGKWHTQLHLYRQEPCQWPVGRGVLVCSLQSSRTAALGLYGN